MDHHGVLISGFFVSLLFLRTSTADEGCRNIAEKSSTRIIPLAAPSAKFPCYCLSGNEVVKCACDDHSLDDLNNRLIQPRLFSILQRVFFRYFKVNLERPCPFWHDDSRCSIRDCAVKTCSADELPATFRDLTFGDERITVQEKVEEACAQEVELSLVDASLNLAQRADVGKWDAKMGDDNFCVLDDDGALECCYIDLTKNPEKYTGYSGPPANRIWKTIYEENCFKPSDPSDLYSANSLAQAMLFETCFEKKAFFRVISGLHSSISIHLCSEYLHPFNRWGPNLQEFLRRFDDTLTEKEGSHRLSNLYFTFSILLRALSKASPRFRSEKFFTGDLVEDQLIRTEIHKFLDILDVYPHHFDESKLFCGEPAEARRLKEEFRFHFRNISRIMDCVGCEKCRLWGKLQTQGIGTALKLLFSDSETIEDIRLKRSEIVSLWNAFGRLSSSITQMEKFRKLLDSSSLSKPVKGEFMMDGSLAAELLRERSEL